MRITRILIGPRDRGSSLIAIRIDGVLAAKRHEIGMAAFFLNAAIGQIDDPIRHSDG